MSEQLPNDDEPTVIRSRGTLPTSVSATTSTQAQTRSEATTHAEDTLALPLGTRLGEFELTHRIGEGGFGIVYQAWDHSLERSVALKEYLPSSIAMRVGQTRITARSARHRETFEAGLKSFINEAKLLARFDHPSLVKVFRFWEANGTAYMIMPFYEGVTMRDTVRAMAQPPGEDWLIDMLAALTEALAVIHAEQCYHRDIAPDNVMLLSGSGKPLLLDFGAARRVIGDMTQALTVILKPGYAPVEQYAEVPGMKQGPWTDVYALAAVVYWAVTGKTPPPSVGRMLSDSFVPLAEVGAGRYSQSFLEAIDRALLVHPAQRTQSIDALREELGLPPPAVPGPAAATPRVDPDATVIRPRKTVTGGGSAAAARAGADAVRTAPITAHSQAPTRESTRTGATPISALPPTQTRPPSRPGQASATGTRAAATEGRPRRLGMGLAAAAGVVLVAAGGWWLTRPAPQAPSPPAPAVAAASPSPTPPAAAPPAVVETKAVPGRAVPRSPADVFAQWQAGRDPGIQVKVRAPASVVVGPQALRVSVTTSEAGYLYLVAYRAGSNDLVLWHPHTLEGRQPLEAKTASEIAMSAWAGQSPLPGTWRVMALVTRQPWDLAADTWQARGGVVGRVFDGAAAPSAPAACPPGAGPCDSAFGAEEFGLTVEPERATLPDVSRDPAAAPTVQAERKPPRPATPSIARAVERPEAKGKASEECARLIQQMSLGEASAGVAERFKALGCR